MNSAAVRKRLIGRDGHNCHLCGQPIFAVPTSSKVKPHEMTIDHVVPVSLGGSNDINNLRLAHQACNQKRGNSPTPTVSTELQYRLSFAFRGVRVTMLLQPKRVFDLRIGPAHETKG